MQRTLGIVIVLAALTGCDAPASDSVAAYPSVEVTVDELVNAYEANEAAAQLRYDRRRLFVTATVEGIKLDSDDEPFINLTSENTMLPVQASFAADAVSQAASLTKGQTVRLDCGEVSEVLGTPMLSDCLIAQ